MKRVLLDISRDAALDKVSDMRALLQNILTLCGVDSYLQSSILLCFSELATNSVRHNKTTSRIGLQFYSDAFGWWIMVKDNGQVIKGELFTPSASQASILEFNDSQEGGRGIPLILHLSERLSLMTKSEDLGADTETQIPWENGICLGWHYQDQCQLPRVLIVDDDPAIRALYSDYLASDFHVDEVGNGMEALEFLQHKPIDIVVSDISMPCMDGIQLRDSMIADETMELIPFIFLTMSDTPQLINRANTMGIDDFLCKPVTKSSLRQTVTRVLTRSHYLKERLGRRIDRTISQALSPAIPNTLFNYQLCVQSRNTGAGGGDILLYQQWEHKALVIVVDVMGHNDAAKFFSYAYAGYIKGLLAAVGEALSPEALLGEISTALYQDTLMSQLMLTCCAIELSDDKQVKIACAGHPRPLLMSTEKSLRFLPVEGTLAGLLPISHYSPFTFQAQAGERIAIYTDGLIEQNTTNKSRENQAKEVFGVIESSITMPLDSAMESIYNFFDKSTKNTPDDDALLLLIEC